ncbi:hypothetical protein PHLGIDRAFT_249413 [Phlebiopsis gigantea 11061_1 CR5-6]|uniref:Uncharacterized protein n=1 Tax=Phlebiopsis gigantea (strain 11061_1 CR5-6) TaxID=745531 RepID=A0A0C3SBT4_PHLG1|nr:hypothetical protein PHLGIDRAFT_249413 [Phlebiopsis gigantea 11061_1 CR5-6]
MDSRHSGTPGEPTVASVLGVKGQLRFHPHGSTQKAHVVLRKVDLAEESDDDEESSMVYFSLFAQKRIEVKPGKEILLAVATPDGKFLDAPVIFAGRVSVGEESIQDVSSQPFRNDLSSKTRAPVIPPKLRKPWLEAPIIESPTSKSQAQRTYASVAIQAEPEVNIPHTSTQPDTIPLLTNGSAVSLPEKPSPLVTAGPSSELSVEEQLDSSYTRERSLSPMELDSRSSTPEGSPPSAHHSATSVDRSNSNSFSPPGLSVPELAEQPQTLLQTSFSYTGRTQPRAPSSSPESDNPPGLSLPPLPTETTPSSSSKVGTREPTIAPSKEQPTSRTRATVPTVAQSPSAPSKLEKLAVPVNTSSTTPPSDQSPDGSTATATPYVPKRKTVPNPFVSGGVLTDFVGKMPPGNTTHQVRADIAHLLVEFLF